MEDDEYLSIFIRSSLAFKKGLMLANSTGIVDSDYYNNADNEGHIMIAYYNTNDQAYTLEKGETHRSGHLHEVPDRQRRRCQRYPHWRHRQHGKVKK